MSPASGRPPRAPASRPRPPARGGRRGAGRAKMPMGVALALVAAALLLGVLLGYAARGDDAPSGLITEVREVPVVTVTVPAVP